MADSPENIDLALCNAIKAIQDNYTFDSFEQAAAIRDVANCDSVLCFEQTLIDWNIKGYDLSKPLNDIKVAEPA